MRDYVKAEVCIHVALCGLTFGVLSGCEGQPKPNCLTAQSAFVVKLYPDPASPPKGDCEGRHRVVL